jgi:hypothetical protein
VVKRLVLAQSLIEYGVLSRIEVTLSTLWDDVLLRLSSISQTTWILLIVIGLLTLALWSRRTTT